MSAFAVIYDHAVAISDSIPFNRMMNRLSHRGSDGCNIISAGHIKMGHWHFWTTPEEVDEFQPLEIPGLPFIIVLDGRIDNRDELFAKLEITVSEARSLSDAALIIHAYAHWGEDCFQNFIGEFALVLYDKERNEIICACDPLGDRILFYAHYDRCLVIASEPWAVAGANSKKPELNEGAIAHYFALRVPENGQTFFNNIFELLPAHILKVGINSQRLWRYWNPDACKKIHFKTDQEYAEQFRILLEESIRCRMRSSRPLGVLMSGGLDSTSVACLAASMIAPKKLTAVSYVFNDFPECDERQYIEAVKKRWNINSIQFTGDNSWTFNDWKNWPHNPNQPDRNFYRLLLENTFKRSREEGLSVLLTGYMGDHLYSAGSDWIADLVVDGQILKAFQELSLQIKSMGWKETINTSHPKRIARRFVDSLVPGALRLPRQKNMPIWINPKYADYFESVQGMNFAFDRHASLLTLSTSRDIAYGIPNANIHGIELRNPYRDRRLVEFILAIPAYQLFSGGYLKYVLRNAMRDVLPEIIRTRTMRTTFESLYYRGIDKEKDVFESYLNDSSADWRLFFRSDWQSNMLDSTYAKGIEGLLPFSCISYETWKQRLVLEN